MLTEERVAEIEVRLVSAQGRSWWREGRGIYSLGPGFAYHIAQINALQRESIAEFIVHTPRDIDALLVERRELLVALADFIARAPDDLNALLAERTEWLIALVKSSKEVGDGMLKFIGTVRTKVGG